MTLFRRRRGAPAAGVLPAAPLFDDRATEADVRACFRLLLNRAPNAEEWRGHALQAGEPLDRVVRAYLGSREFAERRLLDRADPGAPVAVATADGFTLLVRPDDAAVGVAVRMGARYEPDVTAAFARRLRSGGRVLDIGANIGWYTMLAARGVGPTGHVTAVEPSGGNVRLLEASRRLNGFAHVLVLQLAAARDHGILAFYPAHSNASTGPVEADTIARDAPDRVETVPAVRLDALIDPARGPLDLVKIDVEGAELSALEGLADTLRRDRPVLFSEFAPGMLPGGSGRSPAEFDAFLRALGYRIGVIGADGAVAPAADIGALLAAHERSGADHIDLLCEI